jgi:hypothetical protein
MPRGALVVPVVGDQVEGTMSDAGAERALILRPASRPIPVRSSPSLAMSHCTMSQYYGQLGPLRVRSVTERSTCM